MTQTDALRLALDALEDARHHMSASGAFTEIQIAAQDACRAALAAPSGEPVAWYVERISPGKRDNGMKPGVWWTKKDAEEWVDDRHALRALYAAPQPAPAGWRLVPVEPTIQQMAAMGPAIRACYGMDGVNGDVTGVYRAMLDAAPAAPGGEG